MSKSLRYVLISKQNEQLKTDRVNLYATTVLLIAINFRFQNKTSALNLEKIF